MVQTSSLQIGIRGSIKLSKFVGEDVDETSDLMELNAGLSFSIINLGPISIVPEVYYAEKEPGLKLSFRNSSRRILKSL